jgi:tetratricopeptide (TPR) repeat protein
MNNLTSAFLLFACAIFFVPKSFAQSTITNIDSLLTLTYKEAKTDRLTVERYQEAASYYWRSKPDSSTYFAEKAIALSEQLNDNNLLGISIFLKANVHLDRHENDAARSGYLRSIDLLKGSKDNTRLVKVITNLGTTYTNENNYTEASRLYEEALQYAQLSKDQNVIAMVLGNQGIVASMKGDNRKAISLYTDALKCFETAGNVAKVGALRHNIGSLYSNLGENALAIAYTKLATDAYSQTGNHKSHHNAQLNLCYYYKELGHLDSAELILQAIGQSAFPLNTPQVALKYLIAGQIAHEKKDYQHALTQLDSSLVYAQKADNPLSVHNAHLQLATELLALNRNIEALRYAELALASAKEMQDATSINADELVAAKAYAGVGRFKEAYRLISAHQIGKDTTLKQERIDAIRQVEVKYETEKKDQMIHEQMQQLKSRNLLLLLSLASLLIAGAAVYYLRKAKRQAIEINRFLEDQFESLKSQNEHLKTIQVQPSLPETVSDTPKTALPNVIRLNNNQVVKLTDIAYLQASGNGIEIYKQDGTRIHEWQRLKHIKELLTESQGFIQIHRSYLVNFNEVTEVSALHVRLKSGTDIPIGNTQKEYVHGLFDKKHRFDT